MGEIVDISLLGDLLEVGASGFVIGVLVPFGFRLIGYVVDSVKAIIGGI